MAEDKKKRNELAPIRYWGPMTTRVPWGPVGASNLIREMQRMMDEFQENFDYPLWPSLITSPPRFPAIDVKDAGEKYVVEADLPGIAKEEVEIMIGEGVLDISAAMSHESKDEKEGYIRKERGYYSFHRRLALPEDAIAEEVEAKLEDGVLKLQIPKKKGEKEAKKKVEVK